MEYKKKKKKESHKNELCQRIGDRGSGDFSTLDLATRPLTLNLSTSRPSQLKILSFLFYKLKLYI
jgi:hypothetical protein